MFITATVRYEFEAEHWIPDHPVCGKPHKHNWVIEVTFRRKPGYNLTEDGMIHDFRELYQWVKWAADCTNGKLNDVCPVPTCEHLIRDYFRPTILKAMKPGMGPEPSGEHLDIGRMRLWENEKYYCEWIN